MGVKLSCVTKKANEMIFEDLEIVWREQGVKPSHVIDHEALRGIVVERAHAYRKKILLRDISEIATDALVVVLLLGVGIWSVLRHGWSSLNGALIILSLGYALIASFRFVSRQRQKRREEKFDDSMHGNLQRLVANTDYQIRLKRNFFWWYLLPLLPGFILIVLSATTGVPPVVRWIFAAFMALIAGGIYWASNYQLRKDLIPQRNELQSLLAGLENDRQAVELRTASHGARAKSDPSRTRKVFWCAVTAVCFGFAGWFVLAFFLPPQEPSAPEFHDVSAFGASEISRIDEWLQAQVELSDYPSLSVAIVRDGQIAYHRAFGYENTWAARKATTNTAYHVASVTKAFTASLAMLLHHRGVIDLDQPVVKYLPPGVAISTRPELGATITLRQLATHTSGLPRGIPGRVQSVEGRYELEPERLYRLLPSIKLEFDPGTDDLYSNLGFGLLGHTLELAAGKPLNELLQELLCDPLKLERTAFHVDDQLPVATGYSSSPQLPESHPYRWRLAGSGGLVTSTGDLAKFLAAHMKPGLFTSDMLAQVHAPTRLVNGSEIHRAAGWSIHDNNPAGRTLSKNGGRSNCSAWIGFVPEHGVGVAVITNVGEPDVDPIGRWLLERSVPGGYKLATKHGFAKVAPFTGVRWENDRPNVPIVQVQGRWSPLVSIDGLPIDRIMKFAQNEFGQLARKRFAEDLVELLSKMGHEPGWEVTLGLEANDGTVEHHQVAMTEHNRELVRE